MNVPINMPEYQLLLLTEIMSRNKVHTFLVIAN